MKLSKKGFNKIYDHVIEEQDDPMFLNFDQDDFEDVIVLTRKDAKHLLDIVMDCRHDHCITQEETEAFKKFLEQVKQ